MLQRALARHRPTTVARLPLLPPAQESTFVTCCPRPPHGMKWEPPGEPSWRERDDGLLKSGMGRAARTVRASRRHAGTATGAHHGRLRASQAPSGVPRNSYRPWGHRGALWAGVGAYGVRASVKMNNPIPYTHSTSLRTCIATAPPWAVPCTHREAEPWLQEARAQGVPPARCSAGVNLL